MGSTRDARLSHALEHGLGFLHDTMPAADAGAGGQLLLQRRHPGVHDEGICVVLS